MSNNNYSKRYALERILNHTLEKNIVQHTLLIHLRVGLRGSQPYFYFAFFLCCQLLTKT